VRVLSRPFPEPWLRILEGVAHYRLLSEGDRQKLRDRIQIFLDEKPIEGAGGLEIDDTIRVTIAAEACLLLLGRDELEDFPDVEAIVVYPHAYRAPTRQHLGGGVVLEGAEERLGEAHQRGLVVLAWDAVEQSARDARDGHNVVLHEFAHQLDMEDGWADGAPPLERRAMYGPWARVLGAEFQALQEARGKSVLDRYGATNPAEFFAVATEAFFEKPLQLRNKHPELYEELALYYRQDPAKRFGG
jgi:Mlc titration factor MtfA (ptsG expression regulator)